MKDIPEVNDGQNREARTIWKIYDNPRLPESPSSIQMDMSEYGFLQEKLADIFPKVIKRLIANGANVMVISPSFDPETNLVTFDTSKIYMARDYLHLEDVDFRDTNKKTPYAGERISVALADLKPNCSESDFQTIARLLGRLIFESLDRSRPEKRILILDISRRK